MDWKLELVAVPVSDVDRAKSFYVDKVGFNADHDHRVSDEIRFVQLTPPGSACSIALGTGLVNKPPGSAQGLQLVVRTSTQLMRSSSSVASTSARFRSSTGARSSSSAIPTATAGRCSRFRPATSRRTAAALYGFQVPRTKRVTSATVVSKMAPISVRTPIAISDSIRSADEPESRPAPGVATPRTSCCWSLFAGGIEFTA